MKKAHHHTQSGYIALMSAVIISLVLSGLSWSTSVGGFRTRIGMLDHEFQNQSRTLAQSCRDIALLRLAQNYFYLPAPSGDVETIGTDGDTCTIADVIHENENSYTHEKIVTITTRAQYRNTWSTLETKVLIHNDFFPSNPHHPQIQIVSQHEM